MTQLKYNQIVSEKSKISNIFDVPVGLEDKVDVVSVEEDLDSAPGTLGVNDQPDNTLVDVLTLETGILGANSQALQPPSNIMVVSQTVYFAPDKTHVVDVVLGFDDVFGASTYEVQVAKV